MKNKGIYTFCSFLFVFILILKFLIIDKVGDYTNIVNSIFWILSLIVISKTIGLQRDNNNIKTSSIQVTLISLMLYIVLTYLSGLFLGFLKNSYSLTFVNIIKNTYTFAIMIIAEELIRYMVAKKSGRSITPLLLLTILYIVLDFVLSFNTEAMMDGLHLFIYISNKLMPNIARHVLFSYIAKNVSYVPNLILRLYFTLSPFILPIIPDLGYYVTFVIGVLFPYLVYLLVGRMVNKRDKYKRKTIKRNILLINIPLIACLLFVVCLVGGIFKYQIIAIGSGSMEPIIYRGDAVIFEKITDDLKNNLEVGTVIIFRNNGNYITHRIISITESNGSIIYKTKGDNNIAEDDFDVYENDLVGIVRYNVKYIGFPTLWFQELINR